MTTACMCLNPAIAATRLRTVTLATDRMLTCIAMSEIAVYQAVIQYRANTYQLGAQTKMYSTSNRLPSSLAIWRFYAS
eukprot:jgi/Botrbrau1/22675/Bobra.0132s0019.1